MSAADNQSAGSEYLKIGEAAAAVSLTPGYVYRLCSTGKIPFYRFGKKTYRILRSDLENWAASRKET